MPGRRSESDGGGSRAVRGSPLGSEVRYERCGRSFTRRWRASPRPAGVPSAISDWSQFGRLRPDHLAGEEKECGPVDAGAVGLLGRTDTILSCDVECVLDKGVLERVEGDDPKTPTGPEDADCCLQASFEAFQLVVHRDAKRLEGARRRVNPLGPEPPRDHLFHQLAELRGGGDRRSARGLLHDASSRSTARSARRRSRGSSTSARPRSAS